MTCQEVVFAEARCRVDLEPTHTLPSPLACIARLAVVGDDGVSHPLVFADGRRVELHAATESLVLNTAIAYLGNHFGPLSEYDHGCVGDDMRERVGAPVVVEPSAAGR